MKYFRYLILIILILGFVFTLRFAQDPKQRYYSDVCQYNLIFENDSPLDWVAIGGSRVMKSIDAEVFSEVLSEGRDREVVVYDLSRSWRSELHNYRYVKDLYERGRGPKNVLMLYSAYSKDYHPHAHVFATSSDLATLTFGHTSIAWSERLQNYLKLHVKRILFHFQNWVGNNQSPNTKEKNLFKAPGTYDCAGESRSRPDIILEAYKNKEHHATLDQSWDFDASKEQRGNMYTKMVIDLVKEHGGHVYLYWPTRFLKKRMSDEFIKKVEDYFGVPFLVPDEKLFKELFKVQYFSDFSHMAKEGTPIFTKWIARKLRTYEK